MDVNIVIFPGKYIDRDLSDQRDWVYEYQYNMIFSFAKKENVDALIISAGSIGIFTTEERIRVMLEQYAEIPCILLASKIDGYISVVYDNFQGIKEGMEFLIKEKGCTRFGMIGGPDENSDARERKQTFVQVLKEHNLPYKESMFQEGDLSRRCRMACRRLLDQNLDIEAIFCVNDDTAMGLYDEFRLRGIRAGKEIYVFGYDDTVVSTKATPPLSTIRADSSELGQEAVTLAIKILNGENVHDNVVLQTHFIKRDSVFHGEEEKDKQIWIDSDGGFQDIYYHFQHEEMKGKLEGLHESYRKLLEMITNYAQEKSTNYDRAVEMALENFIDNGGVKYADTDNLFKSFEQLYHSLSQTQNDKEEKFRLRDVFSRIYIKLNCAMTAEIGSMQEEKIKENDAIRRFVHKMLQFEKGGEGSYQTLLENLDWLNIKNAALYMLPEPVKHLFMESYEAPEHLVLKAVLKQGVTYTVLVQQQKQPLSHLFENGMLSCEQRYERVLLPLFFNEMLYGVLLCDMTEEL